MASDKSFVTYICDQVGIVGQISFRKMFGEYVIYCYGKVVALVCDNQLFVKPTTGGKAALGTCTEASPYPGAKPHFLVTDRIDDKDWLSCLIATTAQELREPKLRRPKTAIIRRRRSAKK
jgi:TfoX/Sxy family transcriptional regulator of competence genes